MFRALRPIVKKEFRQIRRDPTSLGMLMVLPTALIIFVGYALDFDVRHVPMVVLDRSQTAASRALTDHFKHTELFEFRGEVYSFAELDETILSGRARIALVIPPDFASGLLAGRTARVQILVDGADANAAGQSVQNAARIITDHSARILAEGLWQRGRAAVLPLDVRPRVWYNPDLQSSRFLVPGLIGFILVLTAVISTSLTVVREKERGTMEQIMVSPLKPVQVILGKTVPYLLISLVAATAILVLGYLLFAIEVRGSLLLLYAAILMIILGGLGQGLLVSTVTDSQQVAFMISVFSSLLPSFLLSGFVFPVSSMPVVLQVLSNIAVNKFFLVALRGIMLKGVGMDAVWPQFLYMAIFAAITLGISTRRMQKRNL